MILATLEGNLSGFYLIKLNRMIPLADYVINYTYKDDNGDFIKFIPDFPVMSYPKHVELTIDSNYVTLYIKIEIMKPFVKEGDCAPVPYCDECADMNKRWRNYD